jgi:MarR family transcriptional regulator for hemolysin
MPAITRSINILSRLGLQFRNAHMEGIGVSAAQAPYVLHISARPGRSQEELALALHVNPSNAARQLAHLEKAGFVRRQVCEKDKRRMELHPTRLALDTVPLILAANAAWNEVLTRGMKEEDQQKLVNLLDSMLKRGLEWEASQQ